MESESNNLSNEDAMQVLEHLRSKVREFGFGELDANIGNELAIRDLDVGVQTLGAYCSELFLFLKVFDEASISGTTDRINQHLEGRWSWRLLPGGDREAGLRSNFVYSNGIQDMSGYRVVGTLIISLAAVMRDLGVDVPGDSDGNSPQDPPRRRM